MITALGIIFKLVIGKAIGVVKFAIEHWRIVLPAIVIIVAAWHYLGLRAERDEAIKDYAELKHAFDIAKAENAGRLVELKAEGVRNKLAQDKQHIADIRHIGKLYGKVINNDKASINRYRADIADKLRQQQAASSANGVPKDDASGSSGDDSNSASTRLGEESPEFYKSAYHAAQQYIKTLTQAGAVCAADYNRCYAYAKSEQGRLGVELSSNP